MTAQPLVLVVEDEFWIALDLERTLEKAGFRTAPAASAEEVDRALARERPAAAILDMHLADGMTGPRVARLLNDLGVPVVVASAQARQLADVPAAARLDKPARPEDVLRCVREALQLGFRQRAAHGV